MRALLAMLLAILGTASVLAASQPSSFAADFRPLNDTVLQLVDSYPLGRYPYGWIRGVDTDGVSQSLIWRGTVLGQPDAARSVHCSGITFEVYIQALSRLLPDGGPTGAELLALKEEWYIREGTRSGPVDALVRRGLGVPVETLADLTPGDFVQFWRNNGNGHSAIFISHTLRSDGTPRGLVYWSAQGASEGLGYRRVSIGAGEFQISPGSLYGVRAVLPGDAPLLHSPP
jgi:hypothetical protein